MQLFCLQLEASCLQLSSLVTIVFWSSLVTIVSWSSFAYNSSFFTRHRTLTGRRFHRTTEMIPCRPWKAKSTFASRPIKINLNKGTRGVRVRCDAVLLPFISIGRSPGKRGEQWPKNGKSLAQEWVKKSGAEIHFFGHLFPFRAGGPKWGLYRAIGIAKQGSTPTPCCPVILVPVLLTASASLPNLLQ